MDNFYTDYLNSNPYILETEVTSYYKEFSGTINSDFTTYDTEKINQRVFALDANEVKTNASKFSTGYFRTFIDNPDKTAVCFWTSAGCNDVSSINIDVFVMDTDVGSEAFEYGYPNEKYELIENKS